MREPAAGRPGIGRRQPADGNRQTADGRTSPPPSPRLRRTGKPQACQARHQAPRPKTQDPRPKTQDPSPWIRCPVSGTRSGNRRPDTGCRRTLLPDRHHAVERQFAEVADGAGAAEGDLHVGERQGGIAGQLDVDLRTGEAGQRAVRGDRGLARDPVTVGDRRDPTVGQPDVVRVRARRRWSSGSSPGWRRSPPCRCGP